MTLCTKGVALRVTWRASLGSAASCKQKQAHNRARANLPARTWKTATGESVRARCAQVHSGNHRAGGRRPRRRPPGARSSARRERGGRGGEGRHQRVHAALRLCRRARRLVPRQAQLQLGRHVHAPLGAAVLCARSARGVKRRRERSVAGALCGTGTMVLVVTYAVRTLREVLALVRGHHQHLPATERKRLQPAHANATRHRHHHHMQPPRSAPALGPGHACCRLLQRPGARAAAQPLGSKAPAPQLPQQHRRQGLCTCVPLLARRRAPAPLPPRLTWRPWARTCACAPAHACRRRGPPPAKAQDRPCPLELRASALCSNRAWHPGPPSDGTQAACKRSCPSSPRPPRAHHARGTAAPAAAARPPCRARAASRGPAPPWRAPRAPAWGGHARTELRVVVLADSSCSGACPPLLLTVVHGARGPWPLRAAAQVGRRSAPWHAAPLGTLPASRRRPARGPGRASTHRALVSSTPSREIQTTQQEVLSPSRHAAQAQSMPASGRDAMLLATRTWRAAKASAARCVGRCGTLSAESAEGPCHELRCRRAHEAGDSLSNVRSGSALVCRAGPRGGHALDGCEVCTRQRVDRKAAAHLRLARARPPACAPPAAAPGPAARWAAATRPAPCGSRNRHRTNALLLKSPHPHALDKTLRRPPRT